MTAYLGSMLFSTMAGFFNDISTERVLSFVMKKTGVRGIILGIET